jgi:hypothetical protein
LKIVLGQESNNLILHIVDFFRYQSDRYDTYAKGVLTIKGGEKESRGFFREGSVLGG